MYRFLSDSQKHVLTMTDLIKYCAREEVPFTVFEDWSSILATVQDIVAGKKSVQQAADEGYKAYKEGGAGLNGAAK